MTRFRFSLTFLFAFLLFGKMASAAPEAHILRIDPRAGVNDGSPVLTTLIEIVQPKSPNDVMQNSGCGQTKGFDCLSNALETPGATFQLFPFPEAAARLLVRVDGAEVPAKFVSKTTFGAVAGKEPNMGIAWLIALDASSGMGARYNDAREVANQFIGTIGPNDLVNLVIFDDRPSAWTAASKWKSAKEVNQVLDILKANPGTARSNGSARPLFNQIKNITKEFGELGNTGGPQNIPIHQVMVVLSNGAGRQDAGSTALGAEGIKQYFNKGRFPEDNTASPKTPLPVVSVYFPNGGGMINDMYRSNDAQFMQDLANPETGGFFDIVQGGQGFAKAKKILSLVKDRYNKLNVVKWRLSCLAPTVEQSFNLIFDNTSVPVKPDGSFKDVPIGVNPTQWPLDINVAQTRQEAETNPLYPGGTFRVYGDFCWAGDKQRAESYFVPAGTKPNPNVNKNDPEVAKKAMQSLIAQNMRGGAEEASDTFVVLRVPDDDKVLDGTGDNTIARMVIYDNKAKRASGYDEKTVLTLKARKKPFNILLIAGITGVVVVIGLLLVVLLRGGGNKRGGGKKPAAPPQPMVAGGAPPYGAAPPYGGGGYGGGQPPYGGGGGYPPPGGGSPPL